MVDAVEPQTLRGLRDRALLLLGFAGALRRSELVALDVEDLMSRPEGLTVLIASSKTDQEAEGQVIAIPRVPGSPYCPAQAVLDWQVVAAIDTGPSSGGCSAAIGWAAPALPPRAFRSSSSVSQPARARSPTARSSESPL